MIFLNPTISSSKSIFGMVAKTSSSFSSCCPAGHPVSVLGCFGSGLYTVLLLVLRFVSVAVLLFALLAVGHALLLLAVGSALLPAVGFCYSRFFFIIAPDLRVLLAVLVPLLLYLVLLTTGLVGRGSVSDSHHLLLGVVPSAILSLTTDSLAVVPSVVGYDSVARLWLPPTSLLSAVGALDPQEGSLQQRVLLLFLRSGLRESLLLLLVGVLQCHCVILWTVSPFIMKAFIAASCHCVVVGFLLALLGISVLVSLSVVWLFCHCHTLLPFTCADYFLSLFIVTCFAMSFALWSAAIARLILDASFLHCTRELPTLLNLASSSFCWMRFPLYLFVVHSLSAECGLFRALSLFPCGAPSFC